jgi:magnesium chelatase family protein
MLFRVQSAAVFGIKALPFSVEVDLNTGQKLSLMTVGLPDTAVRESRKRVEAALRNCGIAGNRRSLHFVGRSFFPAVSGRRGRSV